MFKGTYTALVTPFKDGDIDEAAFRQLVRDQIEARVDGIVPVGTTGESPTLDYEEHLRVIEMAVEFAQRKIKVLAGTGANSTSEAIYLTREAEKLGVDGSLQVAPYYNKPTQEGLYAHFRAISRATRLPLVLYSVPSRCAVEIGVSTVQRLSWECPNIVALKEAGGSADRVSQLRGALDSRFTILSGDDSLTLPFLAVGARGVISVASNLIPREMVKMVGAFAAGKLGVALKIHARFYELFKNLFIETNPGPVKAALAMLGKISEEYRLPLVPLHRANRALLKQTLKNCGLLSKRAP